MTRESVIRFTLLAVFAGARVRQRLLQLGLVRGIKLDPPRKSLVLEPIAAAFPFFVEDYLSFAQRDQSIVEG